MDMSEILTIIVKLLAAVAVSAIMVLVPKVKNWITSKISEEDLKQIIQYTTIFVQAADQLLKASDPDGSQRKAYVVEQLTKLGVEVNEQIDAIIESQVLKLK